MAATLERCWPLRQVMSGVHFLCQQVKTLDHANWNNSITTKHLSLGEPRRVTTSNTSFFKMETGNSLAAIMGGISWPAIRRPLKKLRIAAKRRKSKISKNFGDGKNFGGEMRVGRA